MYIKYMDDRGHWNLIDNVRDVEWTYKYFTTDQIDKLYDQPERTCKIEIPDLSFVNEKNEPPANGHRILQLEWKDPEHGNCLLFGYHQTYILDNSGKTIENLTP